MIADRNRLKEFSVRNETYADKETYIYANETYIYANETYIYANETYVYANETYADKETYICATAMTSARPSDFYSALL